MKVFLIYLMSTVVILCGIVGAYFYAREEINAYIKTAVAGEKGDTGEQGPTGEDGLSAY